MSKKDRAPRRTRRELRAQQGALPASIGGSKVETTESLGLRPMSDILDELLEPMTDALGDEASHAAWENTYRLGMLVWNATLPGASPGILQAVAMTMVAAGSDPEDAQAVVSAIVERRTRIFADDARVIIDVQFDWVRGNPYVQVASSVPR